MKYQNTCKRKRGAKRWTYTGSFQTKFRAEISQRLAYMNRVVPKIIFSERYRLGKWYY